MNKIYYLDDNHNIVPKEKSTHFYAQELDENGNLIEEKFGMTNNPTNAKNMLDDVKITPELREILDKAEYTRK